MKYRIAAALMATDAYLVPPEFCSLTCKLEVLLPKIWKIEEKNTRNETRQISFSRLTSGFPLIRLVDLITKDLVNALPWRLGQDYFLIKFLLTLLGTVMLILDV